MHNDPFTIFQFPRQSVPTPTRWNTTDYEEIQKRKYRAQNQNFEVACLDKPLELFSSFLVGAPGSENQYLVEIRSLKDLQNNCECLDFQVNGLGTCKHIEAVLWKQKNEHPHLFQVSLNLTSPRIEIFLDRRLVSAIRVTRPLSDNKEALALTAVYFTSEGTLRGDPLTSIPSFKKEIAESSAQIQSLIRFSSEVESFLNSLVKSRERAVAKENFLRQIKSGEMSAQVLNKPLAAYQIEGLMHLAFTGRALLADEIGMGKSVQALAAAQLLKNLQKVERALIITSPSKKTEWMARIANLTSQPVVSLTGTRNERISQMRREATYFIASHAEAREDTRELNRILTPQLLILDEMSRLTDWQTLTSRALRNIKSEFLFILSHRPIEHRLDDVYSLFQLIDPNVLGPLFRFNRAYFEFDGEGKPIGYKDLDVLTEKIRPFVLRRLRSDIGGLQEKMLEKIYWIPMHEEWQRKYDAIRSACSAEIDQIAAPRIPKEQLAFFQKNIQMLRKLCAFPQTAGESPHFKMEELRDLLRSFSAPTNHRILLLYEWEEQGEVLAKLSQEMGDKLAFSTLSDFMHKNEFNYTVVVLTHVPVSPTCEEIRHRLLELAQAPEPPLLVQCIAEESIEHRLYELHREKANLAEWVFDGTPPSDKQYHFAVTETSYIKRLLGSNSPPTIHSPTRESPATPTRLKREQEEALKSFVLSRADHYVALIARSPLKHQFLHLLIVFQTLDGDGSKRFSREIDEFCHRTQLPRLTMAFLDLSQLTSVAELVSQHFFTCPLQSEEIWFKRQGIKVLSDLFSDASEEFDPTTETARLLDACAKNLQLASHLLKGNFLAEAIGPLAQAVTDGLKTAAFKSPRSPEELTMLRATADVPLSFILSKLIPEKRVEDSFIAVITKIRTWKEHPEILQAPQLKSQIKRVADFALGLRQLVGTYAQERLIKLGGSEKNLKSISRHRF
jgi:hypothetical protein